MSCLCEHPTVAAVLQLAVEVKRVVIFDMDISNTNLLFRMVSSKRLSQTPFLPSLRYSDFNENKRNAEFKRG